MYPQINSAKPSLIFPVSIYMNSHYFHKNSSVSSLPENVETSLNLPLCTMYAKSYNIEIWDKR